MYRHKKIFNYSPLANYTGEYDRPHELMDENSPLFLGFRTAEWWEAFPKYKFQDLNEVMKIFNNFELHGIVKPFVLLQTVNLLDNMTDIEVILTYSNDKNFDNFTKSCITHKIAHGYTQYPLGATFDDKY
tara:strand:+ start:1226 stop:1615 length:390 start_codon:yes stop_codon:yes gene_type:complete